MKHQLPSTFPEEDDNQDQKRETSGTNPKQNRKADHTVEIDGRGDSDRKQELKGNNSKRWIVDFFIDFKLAEKSLKYLEINTETPLGKNLSDEKEGNALLRITIKRNEQSMQRFDIYLEQYSRMTSFRISGLEENRQKKKKW